MAGSDEFEAFERSLYRLSPLGPIATTAAIGIIMYGGFLLNVALVSDFQAFVTGDDGQSMLRLAFILTLILCAAFGVTHFEHAAMERDRVAMKALMPGADWQTMTHPSRMRIATAVGMILGLINVAALVILNADGNLWAFITSIGFWFAVATPLLFIMLARGVTSSVFSGNSISRLVRDHLDVDLYRHHTMAIFGRIALRGAFIWLIFVGIILLFFTDGNSGVYGPPTLAISFSVAFFRFFSTMRPVRKKIRAAKDTELALIRSRLADARTKMDREGVAPEIAALVALEQRTENIREWPIDLPTVAQMPLYLLIPVVPWIGAAFAETAIMRLFS